MIEARRLVTRSETTTSTPEQKTFKGYAVTGMPVIYLIDSLEGNKYWHSSIDSTKWTDLSIIEYPAETWEETDVEVARTHCG